jgi:cytochrome c
MQKSSVQFLGLLFAIASTSSDKRDPIDPIPKQSGEEKIAYYGCASCHTIPGIRGADGLVGPSLEHVASRAYIGGVLENTPENLASWIQDPPHVDPKTAMPNLHVSKDDAQRISQFLYTLR